MANTSTPSLDRKDDHLNICLNDEVDYYRRNSSGFSAYRFDHDALPEIDFDQIDLSTPILGKRLAAPLIIGAMTGGTSRTGKINRRLAWAAEQCQVGIALGSQRKMLVSPNDPKILESYQVKKQAPGIPLLFGNLGAVQLNAGISSSQIQGLIDQTQCDAFNFHLNPLQEAIQPEGDRNFAGLVSKLKDCIPKLSVPVFIKEVGAGISLQTARKIKLLGVQGVETAGVGGTSWAKIESLRATGTAATTGALFARWGIPTVESLRICRAELPHLTVIASGGIRNGIEIAKAIALGADAVALALPILKAAEQSAEAAVAALNEIKLQLQITLFNIGVRSIEELKTRGALLLRPVFDQNET